MSTGLQVATQNSGVILPTLNNAGRRPGIRTQKPPASMTGVTITWTAMRWKG